MCVMYTPSKEPNTFRMTIDKHSVFETSNPLSESVNNLPGTAFESRILSHLQNGGLFHSSKLLPKLTPSPDIKNRFHLSSINNKPLVLSVTSSRFQSDALSTTPPLDSSKSVTADDFTGFWPPSIPPSNHIINQKNDNPLIIQSDEYVPTSISSNQPACCIPTSILSDQTTFKTLVTSIRSPVNHVSVAIFPVLPTHITSSPFRPPLCFIPESVKTAVSNRTFCFVNSSNIDKSPGVCIRSTLVSRKDQPNIVAPASSCDEAETHSHLTLFAKSENISLTPISTLHSLFNETNHLEESCLDTIDIDSTPPKIIQQDELPSLKKLLSCDNCPYTSSNPNRLSRYINSRHLFFPDRDKSKSPYLPIHLASSSDISNEIIVTSLCSTSSSLLPVNIPSSLSITVSTSSLPIDISTSQLPVTNCSPSDSFGTTVFNNLSTSMHHSNNNITELCLPFELLPNIPVTISVNTSTDENPLYSTPSKSFSRRKQNFPIEMPSGSDQIQFLIVNSNSCFCDSPVESNALSLTNKGDNHESFGSSYESDSTLDDTSDDNDLVFLGFTNVKSSSKRLHSPEDLEIELVDSSNQRKSSRNKYSTTNNRLHFDQENSLSFLPSKTSSNPKMKRSLVSENSTLSPLNSSFPLLDISVTLERLTEIPAYDHTYSLNSSPITISSSSSEYSDHATHCSLPNEHDNPQLRDEQIQDDFSVMQCTPTNLTSLQHFDKNDQSLVSDKQHKSTLHKNQRRCHSASSLVSFKPLLPLTEKTITSDRSDRTDQGDLSNTHHKSHEKMKRLREPLHLNQSSPPVTVDSKHIEHFTVSNNHQKRTSSKKRSKQLEIPEEFLTLSSRTEMDANDIQVDILTGELFIKSVPLRSLVVGLKRPRFYQSELDSKNSRSQPRGGRNQPFRNSKSHHPFSTNTKVSFVKIEINLCLCLHVPTRFVSSILQPLFYKDSHVHTFFFTLISFCCVICNSGMFKVSFCFTVKIFNSVNK
ncbi:NAD-dependent protein deacetylase sirtuin-6 [Schistosoma japonicum]|nr:NAD-dependent protein deacetylase sirtuin-6 [Schistosoma japonicum]